MATDPAKLREAPLAAEVRLLLAEANGVESRKELHHWRRAAVDCLEHYADLLESSDIILIRKVEGEWPEDYLSKIGSGVAMALVESGLDLSGKWSAAKNRTFAETVAEYIAVVVPDQPDLVLRTLDALSDSLAKEREG